MNISAYADKAHECEHRSQGTLILDGAAGTLLRSCGITDLDSAPLTATDAVARLHHTYIDAGADIIETCSVCAQSLTLAPHLRACATAINLQAARIARAEADRFNTTHAATDRATRTIRVAGAVGPTAVSLTAHNVTAADLRRSYTEQIAALAEGGVGMLLLETVTDLRNAQTAIEAAYEVFAHTGKELPIAVALYITANGTTPCDAHTASQAATLLGSQHLAALGINCSSLAVVEHYASDLAAAAQCPTILYPSADAATSPEEFAERLSRTVCVNGISIAGGCCGTTPQHIEALTLALHSAE